MKAIICLIFLIALAEVFAADNYMYFDISSWKMDSKYGANLEGKAWANKIQIMMSDNEFQLEADENELFEASTYLIKNRIYFQRDDMKFSTTLAGSNPLFHLSQIEIDNAKVELSKELISIEGHFLNTTFEDLNFTVKNIDIKCETDGEFTTDVDIACLKNTIIKPYRDHDFGYVEINDLEKSKASIQINTTELRIDDSNIDIAASRLTGSFEDKKIILSDGRVNCHKYEDIEGLDFQKILDGCAYEGSLVGDGFKFKSPSVNMSINKAGIFLKPSKLKIQADYASFTTGDGVTYVSGMKIECKKKDVPGNFLEEHHIIEGCLERTEIYIRNVKNDEREIMLDEESTKVNKISFQMNNGEYSLRAKLKYLFKFPIAITGKAFIKHSENSLKIKVNKAKFIGISAKSLALNLIEKFVDSSQVRLNGDTITIKL